MLYFRFNRLAWYTYSMKSEIETLTPYVNTDVKIPRKMLDALTLHEAFCCFNGISKVTEQSVRQFLSERFNDRLATVFDPKFLLKNPNV